MSTNLRNILREHYTSSDNSIPNQQINETPAKSKKCKNVKVPIRTTITAGNSNFDNKNERRNYFKFLFNFQ